MPITVVDMAVAVRLPFLLALLSVVAAAVPVAYESNEQSPRIRVLGYLNLLKSLRSARLPSRATRSADKNGEEVLVYPRVGKRSLEVLKRGDFLNFLADSWQQTGSLRNAIREIQDMTESKRSGLPAKRIPIARIG